MKPITLLAAAFAMLSSPAVLGQAPGEKPAPAPAMKAAAQPAPPRLAQATGRRSRAMEDARSCLQYATNSEIAKCAEQYR